MVFGSETISDLMACCWGEVAYAMGHCLLENNSPECLGYTWIPPWSSWDEMGSSPSTWQFPLGFPEPGRPDLSSTKMKRSLTGVWKHSLMAVRLPLWAAWKRFPHTQLRKNLTAELTANSPQDEVCAHDQEKTRSEQNKGVDLLGRSLIWAHYWVFTNAESVPTELA